MSVLVRLAGLSLVLTLAACEPSAREAVVASTVPTAPAEAAIVPATPAGPPASIELAPGDNPEANVTDVVFLKSDTGAKLYSTAGGDPAINGLYTYIAGYGETSGDGWRVFQIGDFNSWEVVEDRGPEVVLKVSRSWMDGATGDIRTGEELLIVSVPGPTDETITITPAK